MKLFRGMKRSDYQDVLRALGNFIDDHGYTDVRIVETEDGLVMGIAHSRLPVHGVQFHPESIASEHGHLILKNFLDIASTWNATSSRRPLGRTPARRRAAH